MRCLTILLPALLVAIPAQADEGAPETVVRAFYSWVLAHPSRALPSSKERAQLAKIMSPALVQLLKSASDTEAQCVKVAPKGEKPNLIEGDLFVGNYEGATEVAYGDQRRDGEMIIADANLLYVDRRFPKAHRHRAIAWKDQLELRMLGGRWVVNDVRFSQDKSLADGLKAYIDDGARWCARP